MPRLPHLPPNFSLLVASLVAAGLTSLACSGAETQDVLLASGTSSSSSSGASTSSGGASSSSSGASGSSGASSSTSSSGASGSSSGTPGPRDEDCPKEKEPNNGREEANVMAPLLCGTLSKGDSVDHLTFQLAPSTKTMSINFTGKVRLKIEVKGKDAVELTPDNAGVVPFVIGAPYTVAVTRLDGNADTPWRVVLVEK